MPKLTKKTVEMAEPPVARIATDRKRWRWHG